MSTADEIFTPAIAEKLKEIQRIVYWPYINQLTSLLLQKGCEDAAMLIRQ